MTRRGSAAVAVGGFFHSSSCIRSQRSRIFSPSTRSCFFFYHKMMVSNHFHASLSWNRKLVLVQDYTTLFGYSFAFFGLFGTFHEHTEANELASSLKPGKRRRCWSAKWSEACSCQEVRGRRPKLYSFVPVKLVALCQPATVQGRREKYAQQFQEWLWKRWRKIANM